MFCPKCGVHLSERDLIQRNVKYMGNVVVEYDARCPNCNDEIGKVSWGQFTIHPDLTETRYQEEPQPENGGLIPPPPELRTVLRPRRSTTAAEAARQQAKQHPAPASEEEPAVRICPHCGQPWPEGEGEKY